MQKILSNFTEIIMFRKVILLLVFYVCAAINIYATDYCNDVTCPDGWNSAQTGWVLLQLNGNPEIYCPAKVCYCYDFSEEEGPNFFIKKIIWSQDSCYETHFQNINYDTLKQSILKELIRTNQNRFNVIFCPDYSVQYTAELYTSFCYAAYYYQGAPMSIPCDGNGYCAQSYMYCWNNTVSPWELRVKKLGPPIVYDLECVSPIDMSVEPDPNYEIIHPCVTWCY